MNDRRFLSLLAGLLFAFCGAALASAQEDPFEQEEKAITAAVNKIGPSVVRMETVGKVLVATGPSTGLIVSDDGYVISSAFSFVQKPTSILVTLPSGTRAA